MAGVSKCLKYSMFIFNLLFWVCGCIILGVSIWLRVSKDAQKDFGLQLASSGLFSSIDLLIAVGSIIMVLGFLGCCGAMKESKCMLLLFFIGLFLILALQVTAGVLGVVYKPKVEKEINSTLNGLLPLTSQSPTFQSTLQTFEKQQKCCGLINGYVDWGSNDISSCSCPMTATPDLCTTTPSGISVYKQTCAAVSVEFFENHMVIAIGIAFGLVFVEIIGLAFSMTLFCQIQSK
ncbi:tetraspanin-8 [Rhinatrema bivittatum]|uniref:tetraspanin-8 n=1 Tax=Rhinatrema bivittatum TaxID=194408 RepID=UPI0011297D7F|nr:tetraspanin-8 [Rhinatrema bivittatum]